MPTKKLKSTKTQKALAAISGKSLTLNNLLLAIRQGDELTQIEFAKILGVSKQYLCDLEHNRRFASPKAAEGFALKLGYSPQQFVRLCLQDLIVREGMKFLVEVKAA
ncbi:MAG: helix-turn-helix transcriptional regulator [Pseudomonadota bacterium]